MEGATEYETKALEISNFITKIYVESKNEGKIPVPFSMPSPVA
jgi:hypothetical protein